ncbi:MAG: hypothetical protein KDD69_04825 [Bdellovibrionales bacterium]|nr:hypothetical protein [Bdellovibrionales bacterium]
MTASEVPLRDGDEREGQSSIRALQIVAYGILTSQLAILCVPSLQLITPETVSDSEQQPLVPILLGVAAVDAIMGLILRKVLFRVRRSGNREADFQQAARSYFMASLLAYALWASLGCYGLVLWLLYGETTYLHALAAAGTILIALHLPREVDVRRKIELSPAA